MKKVSMKRSGSDQDTVLSGPADQEDEYPWGLRIHLDEDELEKLGMTELPDVGKTCNMEITAKVVSVSEHADEHSKGKSCALQITHVGIADKTQEEKFY